MTSAAMAKAASRRSLRQRRNALPASYRTWAATAAARQILALPGWTELQRVAVYWPNDGELDPADIVAACRERDCELYLPLLAHDRQLLFGRWRQHSALVPNHLGIPEPEDSSPRAPAELDAVVAPLVGWQRDGTRLGMGGGYYDRSLAGADGPLFVGLGYDCQELSGMGRDAWDVPMDFVVTETALHRCAGAAGAEGN